ncbi:MAG: putative transcriptional regulator [Firmicutes bacterium]|nr:putative transcriptional regulator [Bacillota bacterium]
MDPYEYAFKCFASKWKPLILRAIYVDHVTRFSAFKKTHYAISEKVLSKTLRELEAEGFVKRTVFAEVPVRVEYVLTEAGQELIVLLDTVYRWSRKRMLEKSIPIDPVGEKFHGYVAEESLDI